MRGLAAAPWVAAEEAATAGAALLVPVGATEQHGPHLPLGTDTDLAVALAEAAAERLPDALVAPALAYGSSGEHAGFPGTLSVGAPVTEALLVELGRSAGDTFALVVLVSTHGGNAGPLQRAVARLRAEGREVRAWGPRWEGDAHAGRTETSLMLAVAPDRVRLADAVAGDTRPVAELLETLRAGGVRAVSPTGVLGDPAGASADEGRRLLAGAVDQLVAFVGHARGTDDDGRAVHTEQAEREERP